jgi:iron-sulfur cluster repair protein YtfE (RIC family)
MSNHDIGREVDRDATAAGVRHNVLQQHAAMREVFHELLDATTRTLQGDPASAGELAGLVRDFRSRFRAHLAYEERYLAPVLAEVDIWGPQRVTDLLNEHAEQRSELDALIAGIDGGWDAHGLALTTRSLVTELLADMAEEERGCLSAELLRDDVVNFDQATD